MDLREVGWGAWTGSIWLRIGTGGGLLWRRWWTFGFHKMRGISWVAEDVLGSQEGLCSMAQVFERVWKDTLMAQLQVLPRNSPEQTHRKIPKTSWMPISKSRCEPPDLPNGQYKRYPLDRKVRCKAYDFVTVQLCNWCNCWVQVCEPWAVPAVFGINKPSSSSLAQQPNAGQDRLILEVSTSQTVTRHSR
jgi:hypothetical protein